MFTKPNVAAAWAIVVAILMATALNVSYDRAQMANYPDPPLRSAPATQTNAYNRAVDKEVIRSRARFWNAEILILGLGWLTALLVMPSMNRYTE